MTYHPPLAVASSLPCAPPTLSGFPVITPNEVFPTILEYSSIIQDMVRAFVPTSGAEISLSGPMKGAIFWIKERLKRSSSPVDNSLGLQITPPFAPPRGRRYSAHFHVIRAARARTSSAVMSG